MAPATDYFGDATTAAEERGKRIRQRSADLGMNPYRLLQAVREALGGPDEAGKWPRGTGSYETIYRLWNGETLHPTEQLLRGVAEVLGVRVEWLQDLQGPATEEEVRTLAGASDLYVRIFEAGEGLPDEELGAHRDACRRAIEDGEFSQAVAALLELVALISDSSLEKHFPGLSREEVKERVEQQMPAYLSKIFSDRTTLRARLDEEEESRRDHLFVYDPRRTVSFFTAPHRVQVAFLDTWRTVEMAGTTGGQLDEVERVRLGERLWDLTVHPERYFGVVPDPTWSEEASGDFAVLFLTAIRVLAAAAPPDFTVEGFDGLVPVQVPGEILLALRNRAEGEGMDIQEWLTQALLRASQD